jgi:lipopolysaccharide export system protein LptA
MNVKHLQKLKQFIGKAITVLSLLIYTSLLGVSRPPLLISPINLNEKDFNFSDFKESEKKKTSKVPASWGGSSLSQETKKVDGFDMTVYSLSGGAWIYHKKVKLSSNTLEIIGEEAYKGFLKGQTKVEDPENGIMLTAGKGIYDKAAETVVLEGRPTLYFTDKEKKVTKITSPYLKRYLSENKTVFEGGAIVENGEYTIYSDSAVFLEKDESLLMENYPFIFGKDTFLTGEKVTYSNSSKNTVLENDTILLKLGYENQRKKKTLKKESKEVAVNNDKSEESEINTDEKVKKISLFTGEKMIYQTGDDETRYVGMFGNAKMIRDDFEFTGSYIKAFGKENGNIEAKEGVVLLDKENHVRLSGDLLEHSKEKNYSHITENAMIEFLDKENTEVNSTMTSIEIERFGERKEIVSRGEVNLVSNESTVNGEYATYFEESEKMFVDGNPSLKQENKTVYCGRIIIYPNSDKIILTDGLNVNKK